jgi:hypothetical protein
MAKWAAIQESLSSAPGVRVALSRNDQPASVRDVIDAWQQDESFNRWFIGLLADSPYRAFRWETPATTAKSLTNAFEFVLFDCPSLERTPDQNAFAKHFQAAHSGVITFANLGADAVMVVPCPMSQPTAYGHLAAFVREAPAAQQNELWKCVGSAMQQRVNAKPVWLSTAGAGVSWLHVRLDDRPKYYHHDPYRRAV